MRPISQGMNFMELIARSRFIVMTRFTMRLLDLRVKLEIKTIIALHEQSV